VTLKTIFRDLTLKTLEKLSTYEKVEKLNSIGLINTCLVDKILKFNYENKIGLYRIPTNLLPFPTHPSAMEWNWREIFKPCFEHTGKLAKDFGIKISFHADEYTIINSTNETVFQNSVQTLSYLSDVLDFMGVKGRIVIHIGGVYGDKNNSIKRFKSNFNKLPKSVREKLIAENDDKQYDWKDVLEISKELCIPMVLDIHHYKVNNLHDPLTTKDVKEIFSTWKDEKPKIHLSSPQNKKDLRAHAEYINIEDFLWFLNITKIFDYDIMLEAKAKELAALKFREDLKYLIKT